MRKIIPVKIDHVGMFSNLFHPANVMFRLGFSGEGGCTSMPLDIEGQAPRCMRFVLDNCYLEFAINRDPKKYGGATHGINYFEFASTDIRKTRENAVNQGFETTDLVFADRYADHGEKKGTAIFECVALKDDVIPNIETEAVCHKTRELFYDNGRYLHANGITSASGIILCCDDQVRVDKMESDLAKFDLGLGDWGEGTAIRQLNICDRGVLLRELGISIPVDDCRNTGGVVLETPNYAGTAEYLRNSGERIRETAHGIVIDLVAEQNIFFVVPKRG